MKLAAATLVSILLAVVAIACGNANPPMMSGDAFVSEPNGTGGRGVRTGPCDVEGQTVACTVETGRTGSVANCFSGTQTCTGGQWSPCGGTSGTLTTVQLPIASSTPSGGDGLVVDPVTATDPSADAGGCNNNPCNPGCMGIDVDAGGLTLDGGFATGTLATNTSFNLLPGPKVEANPSPNVCSTSPTSTSQCSYDTCCDPTAGGNGAGTGACVQWPSSMGCSKCNGVDYTMAVGCRDATTGDTHIAVCNRGTATTPATGSLVINSYPSNPPSAGSSAVCAVGGNNPDGTCTIDLSLHPIASGNCIDLDFAKAASSTPPAGMRCTGNFSGNRYLQINPAHTLPECDLCNDFSFNFTQQGACTTYTTAPSPIPPQTFRYTATCPAQSRPQWNQLAYSTQVPTQSDVLFQAATAPLLSDGGAGTFGAPVKLADPGGNAGDPAICPMSGTDGGSCPKNLASLLGSPWAGYPVLNLTVTLNAVSAVPVVNSWSLTYTCVPSE